MKSESKAIPPSDQLWRGSSFIELETEAQKFRSFQTSCIQLLVLGYLTTNIEVAVPTLLPVHHLHSKHQGRA
jgi:hypothetical protein